MSSDTSVQGSQASDSTSSTTSTQGQAAPASPTAGVDMNSQVSSLAQLREQAPKVWNMMLQGIAMNICNDMKQKQDDLKRMMRESQRDA